jgi:hypothetical protein
MTPGRLPYAPLERQLRLRWDTQTADECGRPSGDHGLYSDTVAANLLGVTRWAILKWRREGMPAAAADRAAIAAGTHPLLVWGQAWLCAEIGADVRRQAARLDRAAAASTSASTAA